MNEATNNGKTKWLTLGQVHVYARRDGDGKPTRVDAIDENENEIRAVAERLQRAGYGVMRERVPRAGRVSSPLTCGLGRPRRSSREASGDLLSEMINKFKLNHVHDGDQTFAARST